MNNENMRFIPRLVLNTLLLFLLMANFGCSSTSGGSAKAPKKDYIRELYGSHFNENLAKAQQGDAFAQYSVGAAYWFGAGVTHNNILAAKWLIKSAEQNCASAQDLLAFFYAQGIGVPKDNVEAYKWAYLAYSQGEASAEESLRRLNLLTDVMTRSQIAEGKELAREFKARPSVPDPHK